MIRNRQRSTLFCRTAEVFPEEFQFTKKLFNLVENTPRKNTKKNELIKNWETIRENK